MRPLPRTIFRAACLSTAIANMGGSLVLLLAYRPLFAWLGAPLPADPHTFAATCVLSFAMGVAALHAFRDPTRNTDLLEVGIAGKGLFAAVTYYFWATRDLHWLWLALGAYDAFFVVVFFLFLMSLRSTDLAELQRGDIHASLRRDETGRALVLAYSLTGNGSAAVDRLRAGLERGGYQVDVRHIQPIERLFRFPMSFWDFIRVIARAAIRVPTRVAPLDIPRSHDYDLVVVETQTWLLGMSAPVEAVFQDPANAHLFQGRDAAALVVCRGAWRRSQAMVVRWLQRRGANVVGARGFTHAGWEPLRLFTLWMYLISRGEGAARRLYGLSEETLLQIETFGQSLAERHRPAPARTSDMQGAGGARPIAAAPWR